MTYSVNIVGEQYDHAAIEADEPETCIGTGSSVQGRIGGPEQRFRKVSSFKALVFGGIAAGPSGFCSSLPLSDC